MFGLERSKRPIQPARVRGIETETSEAIHQVVPVGRTLVEQEEDAGTQEAATDGSSVVRARRATIFQRNDRQRRLLRLADASLSRMVRLLDWKVTAMRSYRPASINLW